MSYIAIDKQVFDKVTTYLGKRPYIEVFHLFNALQKGVKPLKDAINAESADKEGKGSEIGTEDSGTDQQEMRQG
jgi:hypothetical protein